MKKLCLFGLFLLLTAGMVFAGAGSEKKGGLNIHYLSSRSESEAVNKRLMEIAAEYKQTHPDFNFTIEAIPDRASFLQKVKILAAGNELPDWFDADPETFFATLVKAGKVYNIDKLYGELGVSDKVYEISKAYLRLPGDGNLSLMAWQANAEYFFYNKDMFRTAGITAMPKDFDEFLVVCQKLKDAGFTPIALSSPVDGMALRYPAFIPFRMTGNKFINDAVAGKVSFGSAPGIATAEYMQKLSQYFQAGYAQSNYDNMIDLFVGNRAAIMYNGTWCTAQGITGSDGNLLPRYGYFTLPKYKANDATPLTDYWANSGIGTAIKTESATPEMKDFLAFVFKRYPDISVEKYSAIPPIRPSASAKISTLLQTILKDIEGVKEYGYCWDVVINQGALETLDKAIIDLWLGRLTPQQWAKTMDDAVAESLKN